MQQQGGKHAVVVGNGLAGALLACYLADAGWRVDVYDKRPDPRRQGYAGGRSINLALSVRGLTGLRGAGLDEFVLTNDAIRMPGRMLHAIAGSLAFQPYSSDPKDAINSVSRGGLNLTLINAAARRSSVRLFFDHTCVDAEIDKPAATFARPDGSRVHAEGDLVIGADGAFSAVRLAMMVRTDRFDYSQQYLRHGYKELCIPTAEAVGVDPGRFGGFAMDPNALHIWPRGGAMMIALPNRDRTFTCTLFWPFEGEHGFERIRNRAEAMSHFQTHYPDAVPLMPTLAEDFERNPVGSLVTVRCRPWRHKGRAVLVGDAAHAIVPFYGQGMNAAFEDCLVLSRCLAEHRDDPVRALEQYERSRLPNANAIADMAIENFTEMRDLAGRPEFQFRKKIEQALHRAYGERLLPQYNLVSFSTVPYALAQQRGRQMEALVRRVAESVPAPAPGGPELNWEKAVAAAAAPFLDSVTPIPAGAALQVA